MPERKIVNNKNMLRRTGAKDAGDIERVQRILLKDVCSIEQG